VKPALFNWKLKLRIVLGANLSFHTASDVSGRSLDNMPNYKTRFILCVIPPKKPLDE